MDHFGSQQPTDQDREPQFDPLKPPAPPPNTGQWANIVIAIVVVAVIIGAVFWGYRWTKQITESVIAQNPDVIEATLAVTTANDGMVSESSKQFPVEDIAARPQEFKGKWLFTDGTISWLMDKDTGDPAELDALKEADRTIYWLQGPVVVLDHRKLVPERGAGGLIRPWGKVIEVPADKLGLSDAGMAKLQAMPGYNGSTVAMIIARFIEWP